MTDHNPYAAPTAEVDPEFSFKGQPFKFKYLNASGHEEGFRSLKGEINEGTLILDGQAIPMVAVPHAVTRGNRVVLSAVDNQGSSIPVMFAVRSGQKGGRVLAEGIKKEVNRTFSTFWASSRREELRKEGKEALFRSRPCNHCAATIDLTGFPKTPQAYCRYCDSVNSPAGEGPADEGRFRRCDGCGYVATPRLFDTHLLVFLMAFFYYQSRKHFICHACMRREGWLNLLKNTPTLVGVPFAVVPLVKAYLGGSARSVAFSGLDSANKLARKGRLDPAEALYGEILARQRHAAAVHFNRAMARADASDWNGCLDALNDCWADCANYAPGVPLAKEALKILGRHDEIPALLARWEARA